MSASHWSNELETRIELLEEIRRAAVSLLDRTDMKSMLPGEIDNLKDAVDAYESRFTEGSK